MSTTSTVRIEIDGRALTAEQASVSELSVFGHFTAMQVRGGRVRGLEFHLARLAQANEELFGAPLDRDLVRERIRHALGGDTADATERADASVRVYMLQPAEDSPVVMKVTVRAPVELSGVAQTLQSVPYQRPVPHIKQVGGGFGQAYFGRLAVRNGFDDALLTGPGGLIVEAAIANIAFFDRDGGGLVWPDAPALAGITMQVLEARLAGAGVESRRAPVHLADLFSFGGCVVTNARGIAPVSRIDDVALPLDEDLFKRVVAAYESTPWDEI